MQQRGYRCLVYAAKGSDVPCELVNCLDDISSDTFKNIADYNIAAGKAIASSKQPGDMIMCFHGWENREAANLNKDLHIVEPSIGYDPKAIFAPYRVFTSYAQMHMFYGARDMLMTPSWFDTVIPNAFSPEEFTFEEHKDDYVLIFGRVIENKGLHIAIQATECSGDKLIVAGPGSLEELGYRTLPSHVSYVGVADAEQRRRLMSKAKAIIGPTYYVEPFGNMVVEGYFSGTPAITSDWGGFTDTVLQGQTGFRCREFREFVYALHHIDKIKPNDCYNFAMNNFSETVVHDKFDMYFKKILANNFYRS